MLWPMARGARFAALGIYPLRLVNDDKPRHPKGECLDRRFGSISQMLFDWTGALGGA